ncbi:exopolysaccharide biosynthesis protein [Rhizobium sp. 007]|uniref:exopolysaccharide biosynthesis protein n=1 Tax=Rhizobium sp. 007 TaxID=2785056 RepID=UPI0024850AD2|nr:exopolysaccharide biosynthesis protein [Rhizobium sp. 007]
MSEPDETMEPSRGVATARLREMLELARKKGGLSIGEALEVMGSTGIAFTVLFLAIPALTPIPARSGWCSARPLL